MHRGRIRSSRVIPGWSACLVLLLLVAGVAGACSRGGDESSDTGDVNIEIAVAPDPPEMGPAVITVRLTDADGNPINDADVEIEGNMSHAGMEPVIAAASGGQDGRYTSEDFEFTMGGDWIITVSGRLSDGEAFEQTFDLEGVTS